MDTTVAIAIISASSAIGGGLATALTQYFLGKVTASREEKKQRRVEFRNRIEESVIRLLEETDPDIHPVPSIPEITRNVIRLQLYLDLDDQQQLNLNNAVNSLAESVAGYSDTDSKAEILDHAGRVLVRANTILRIL